jgi:hypothetical protein
VSHDWEDSVSQQKYQKWNGALDRVPFFNGTAWGYGPDRMRILWCLVAVMFMKISELLIFT